MSVFTSARKAYFTALGSCSGLVGSFFTLASLFELLDVELSVAFIHRIGCHLYLRRGHLSPIFGLCARVFHGRKVLNFSALQIKCHALTTTLMLLVKLGRDMHIIR